MIGSSFIYLYVQKLRWWGGGTDEHSIYSHLSTESMTTNYIPFGNLQCSDQIPIYSVCIPISSEHNHVSIQCELL